MAKTDNIFVRAKAYRRLHPRTSFQDAIQKVKGGKAVKGPKPHSKVGVAKAAGKVAGKRKRTASIKVFTTDIAKNDVVTRGQAIINRIEHLERERAKQKDKDARDFYSLAINKEHKKLRELNQKIR